MEQHEALELGDFFIDIYEVTNAQYRIFVDAGGYEDPACWKHPFIRDEQTISFEDAMDEFVDQTGRAGPSGWKVGAYPDGEDNLPVGGISWYESGGPMPALSASLYLLYITGLRQLTRTAVITSCR